MLRVQHNPTQMRRWRSVRDVQVINMPNKACADGVALRDIIEIDTILPPTPPSQHTHKLLDWQRSRKLPLCHFKQFHTYTYNPPSLSLHECEATYQNYYHSGRDDDDSDVYQDDRYDC